MSKTKVKILLLIMACVSINMCSQAEEAETRKIGYIRRDIPSFEIPSYKGERYEDTVPYTLDLQERCEITINCLTSSTDPQADYEIFWKAYLLTNTDPDVYNPIDFEHYQHAEPPTMAHDWSDTCQCKFMEALPLLRVATGSDLNTHVDPAWMTSLLKSVGPDGLIYLPTEGRPWAWIGQSYTSPVWRADGTTFPKGGPHVAQHAFPTYCGRMIGVMTIYYLRDKNPIWKETIERMVDRLAELSIDKGDWAYLPQGIFEPNAKPSRDAEMYKGIGATLVGWVVQGLAQYYGATGYEPAKELAAKFSRYMAYHGGAFSENGIFLDASGTGGPTGAHFHHHAIALLGMLEYAISARDQEMAKFVRNSYEWAKSSEARGSPLVGFFPEWIAPDAPTSETCEVADMIALAIKLADAGLGDYWDDADRWVRNQFAENQLTKTDWVYRRLDCDWASKPSGERVKNSVESQRGAFAGWPTACDWTSGIYSGGIMHCCTGNAARTLYYVWRHILDYEDGHLKVNLLLNRASRWADVYSHIPYQGRVDLKIKQSCLSVSVRVPEWIETGGDEVECMVDGKPRACKWEGRYVNLGKVKGGSTVTATFPISERTVKARIGAVDYTLVIKGNTVVFIDPPGKICPLYQRDHYRENRTLWVKETRFVSEDEIDW